MFGFLRPEENAILLEHPEELRLFARRLIGAAGGVFSIPLDCTQPGIIARLVEKGGPWKFKDGAINDANFPTTESGVILVGFRILRGEDMRRSDGFVYRDDVDAKFKAENMRRPNAAEALLVSAEDKQIGLDGRPLVMFVRDSPHTLLVIGSDKKRYLHRIHIHGDWASDFTFLGVCE